MSALELLKHRARQVNLFHTIGLGLLLMTMMLYQTTGEHTWLIMLGPVIAALCYAQHLISKHICCVWCRADFYRLLHNGFYLDTKGLKACPFCAKRLDDELTAQ